MDSKCVDLDLDSKTTYHDAEPPPPAYDDVVANPPKYKIGPAALILDDESVNDEASPETPLYRLSRTVTIVTHKSSSITLERLDHAAPDKADTPGPPLERRHGLFYLVHPANARYRTDVHPYYMTAQKPGMLGNVRLETTQSRLQRTEFKALLSPGRSAADDTLFDANDGESVLFSAKTKWMGGRCNWTDAKGMELAFEDGKSKKPRLVITAAMETDLRDALVGVWCLKVWRDAAETSTAKKDELAQQMSTASSSDMDYRVGGPGVAVLGGAGA